MSSALHRLLDVEFSPAELERQLAEGADPNQRLGVAQESALHVAVRRRRLEAIDPLLDAAAEIDAKTAGGKSAWVHAYRRGFDEITAHLASRGADCSHNPNDELSSAITHGDLGRARLLLDEDPTLPQSDNPEEARLLADIVGYDRDDAARMLLERGADIAARGLDGGTPLHIAAWFGAPKCVRLLLEFDAPLELRGDDHDLTPLGWLAHGSRFSGGADERQEVYVDIARQLLDAGAKLEPSFVQMASDEVRQLFDAERR